MSKDYNQNHRKKKAQDSANKPQNLNFSPFHIAMIMLAFCVVLGTTISAVILFVVQKSNRNCDGSFGNSSNPLELQICRQLLCSFDVSRCDLACPFGYTTGNDFCPNSCTCAVESYDYQGDIHINDGVLVNMLQEYGFLYEEDDGFSLQQSSYLDVLLWNEILINERYKIAFMISLDTYNKRGVKAIKDGLEILENSTCIDFLERTTQRNFLKFVDKNTCHSFIGRLEESQRSGAGQDVSIDSVYCVAPLSVAHELVHALGFHHEQSRADRDSFVEIKYSNIKKGKVNHFNKLDAKKVQNLGTEYDHDSIMHFGGYDFASDWSKPTIVRLDNGEPAQLNDEALTELDFKDINTLYKCSPSSLMKPSTVPTLSTSSPVNPLITLSPLLSTTKSGSSPSIGATSVSNVPSSVISVDMSTTLQSPDILSSSAKSSTATSLKPEIILRYGLWEPWDCSSCGFSNSARKERPCIGGSLSECKSHFLGTAMLWFEVKLCRYVPVCFPDIDKTPTPAKTLSLGSWSPWDCSQCAEFGYGERQRSCIGGIQWECLKQFKKKGILSERKVCLDLPCWHNNYWGLWGKWGSCSTTCGEGLQIRYRNCSGAEGSCPGLPQTIQQCNLQLCQGSGVVHWSSWSVQVLCSKTCGGGRRFSTRTCPGLDRNACPGIDLKIEACNLGNCDSESIEMNDSPVIMHDDPWVVPVAYAVYSDVQSANVTLICPDSSVDEYLFGDLNKDGKTDLLCRDRDGSIKVALADVNGSISDAHWQGTIRGCKIGRMAFLDFNGDGTDDLLCQNKDAKLLSVFLSQNGRFTTAAVFRSENCTKPMDRVIVGLFNGDDKTDFLCDHRGTEDIDVVLT